MDIYWPCKTAIEYFRLLSSEEFKHLLMLFGTGMTEVYMWSRGLPETVNINLWSCF